ncbi:DUF4349 domain-containing protein [Emticicia sp. TH156]|uniref:DUF4349 domain-containing protein n=1 Tax=Emticicia sp. TH156 TaxID=2067454 RepID=UPI000C767BB5|nr:DUF4349 domain-containing protein [Emticicia sp. TH156]PLK43318.1 hypothetical protein C0V77_15500 [Emticicia sp. TH156]
MRFTINHKAALLGAIGCFFMACASQGDIDSKAEEPDLSGGSEIAPEKQDSLLRSQFILKVDLDFKVKDVRKSSEQIEELALKYNGFVSYAHMQSEVEDKKTIIISPDSLMEISSVNITNNITLRIPNRNLQSLLKDLNGMILYINHRTIEAEEVSLRILSSELAAIRHGKFVARSIKVHQNRKGDIETAVEAEETLLAHQMSADESKLKKLGIQEQVNLSTITIHLYQPAFLDKTMVENNQRMDTYRTGFWVRIQNSLMTGWVFLEDAIVLLMKLWVFILVAVGMIWLLRTRKTGYAERP